MKSGKSKFVGMLRVVEKIDFYTKKSCFFVRDFKENSNNESSGCIEKNLFFMTKFTWNLGVFARAYGMTTCS